MQELSGSGDPTGAAASERTCRVVALSSSQVGVGKSTIAANLAIYFRALRPDLPVLLLGLDGPSLVDRTFAPEQADPERGPTIETAWKAGDLRGAIRAGRYGVHYVPTSPSVSSLKLQLRSRFSLSELLRRLAWKGLVVIDTPGDLEILSQNALAASDLAILVTSNHETLTEAEKVFELLREFGRPREAARILLSLVDLRVKRRPGESRDVLAALLGEIRRRDLPLFETFVSRSPTIELLHTCSEGRVHSVLHEARGSLVHHQLTRLAHCVLAALNVDVQAEVAPKSEPQSSSGTAWPMMDERRRDVRCVYRQPIAAFRGSEPSVLSLTARDLSSGGLACSASSAVESGERLHVGLELSDEADPLLVWGRVTRMDHRAPDGAVMAVAFESLDRDACERLAALVRDLPKSPAPPEHRDSRSR